MEHPSQLFARGSILRGVFTDHKSPIAYGYDGKDLPVYFNQDPVFSAGRGGGRGGFGGGGGRGGGPTGADALAQNVTPNVTPVHISPYDETQAAPARSSSAADEQAAVRQQMRRSALSKT